MKKTLLLLLSLIGTIHSATAQLVWQKKLPFTPQSVPFVRLTYDGEQYFIGSHNGFAQVDRLGSITGFFKQTTGTFPFWTSTIKKHSTTSGHPYFLVVSRQSPSSQTYSLFEHRPGVGKVNEKVFSDTSGAFSGKRPQMVEINDSVFVVFGRKYYRKIRYSQSGGFTEEWAKPLNLVVESVCFHNNLFILADAGGSALAMDEDENIAWSYADNSISFRSLQPVADGFIGCGHTTNNKAFIIKFNTAGVKIWEKESEDKDYYDIIPTPNGYAVTGESNTSNIMLALTDAEGNQVWKQEYGPGAGAKVLQDPDGGFVLATRSMTPVSFKLIKTDVQGLTAPIEDALVNNRRIETTGIQATFTPSPTLFFDGNDATFISPPDTVATIFTFAPWISGLDDNNNLHLAADDYSPGGNSDYRSGLALSGARDFHRVWLIAQSDIDHLRFDFGTDQTLDEFIPFDLLTWPAEGNPNLRYNLDFTPVETDLALFPAPFEDANGDGIYNVYDGDYPRIKGDQMAWWVLTDSTAHQRTHGEVLNVDLLISAYAYNCPQNGSVDKSLFVDFEVINHSATDYHNAYMGFFMDPDLGCYDDDNIGSIPDANTFYVYNADDFDGNCSGGVQGFGSDIPVQTVSFTNKSLSHFINFNNTAVGNPPPGTTDPDLPSEFNNLIQGKWKDGTPLTIGGTGYNPGSTNYTNYIYPGNPADPQDWSMCTVNLSYTDRRIMSSHGPFDFAAGDTFNIQLAFTLHPDIPHPCPDIFSLVKPAVQQISQWKNDGALDVSVDLGQVVNLPPGQSVLLDPGAVPGATYVWSTGASTPTITVTQPGEYSATVTPATGCQIVENVLVQLGTFTSLPAYTPAWSIRPNPASDFVTVECADCTDGTIQAVLRNAQGVGLLTLQGQNRQFRLETNNFPPGFYWLELRQHGKFIGSRKLVIARE